MTITFFSNFLNDHQLPFCEEIINHVGLSNFHFVASRQIDLDRLEMGFENMNETKSFVVRAYQDKESLELAQKLMIESDVAIIGSTKNMPIKERSISNKLTFRYNERILKKGDIHLFDPRLFKSVYNNFTRYKCKNVYTFCASAYTARDLALFGYPKTKCYKWGYFPKMKIYEDIDVLLEKKKAGLKHRQDVSILWVGRLIGLKHPEHALAMAKKLKEDNVNFNLKIIGSGNMYSELDQMIHNLSLSDKVSLLGNMSPDEVRDHMEKSQIFLFTSDKREGWGAVLNESMNSACAVVANKVIGSVPFLINHGENGMIYGNINELYDHVKFLIDNPDARTRMGRQAYVTMSTQWNAKDATNRLFEIIKTIQDGQGNPYKEGPCSLV